MFRSSYIEVQKAMVAFLLSFLAYRPEIKRTISLFVALIRHVTHGGREVQVSQPVACLQNSVQAKIRAG